MTPHVRPSTEEDCVFVAANLRTADRQECALWDVDPLSSLQSGLKWSLQPLTIVAASGNPCAMFGITVGKPESTCWLLGTDEILDLRMSFLRQTFDWMDHVCRPLKASGIEAIGNWVDPRNEKHVQWLLWSGFTKTSTRSTSKDIDVGYYRKAL